MNTALIEELEPGWTVHTAPTGHKYYYNAETKKSTYKRPVKSDHHAVLPSSRLSKSPPTTTSTNAVSVPASTSPELIPEEHSEVPVKQIQADTAGSVSLFASVQTLEVSKDRPKRKEAITTALPWMKVYTRLNRVFYHNPTTNESCWIVPAEIALEVARWANEQRLQGAGIDAEYEAQSVASDLEEEQDNDDEDYPREDESTRLEEYNEDDIAWQLEAMENEGQGAFDLNEEPGYSHEEKDAIFTRMLVDYNIDPFSTWEAEISKIASDPRYLVFDTTHQRKSSFERYCITRATELQVFKASERKVDSRIPFLRMAKEALSQGMYFQDFKRKIKKEPAYRAYGNSDHDREKLYRALQDKCKLPQAQKEADFIDLISTSSGESKEIDPRYYLLDSERMANLAAECGKNLNEIC